MSATNRAPVARSRALTLPRVETSTVLLTIAALATVIMLQAMRVLVSYLVVVVGQANRGALERDTFAVFFTIAAAPLLIWLLGIRFTAVVAATAISIVRIILQFWTEPNARLIMAAAIVILWGWLTASLLGTDRNALALGLLAGMVLDVAIRVAFLTLDLPWNSGIAATTIAVILAAFLLASTIPATTMQYPGESAFGPCISLIAIGPGIAMFHLVGGNLGLAQTKTGLDFAPAMAVLAIGLSAGLLGSAYVMIENERRPLWANILERAVLVAFGGVALWVFWTNETLAPFALPIVAAANLTLLGAAIWSNSERGKKSQRVAPSIWLTLGMLLQVAILFYYYDASGRTLYMAVAAVLLGIGSLLGVLSARGSGRGMISSQSIALLAAPVILLAMVCAWQFIGTSNPKTGSPLADTFTVMTYNLQDGFAANNSFDLEAQADTIAASNPDVVVLQEVSRGWLVTSGADEALWLSHRLNMPIYFGGNSDDGLWGNAILTRAPVSEVQQHYFTVTKNLKRGTIEARVPTTTNDFWVIGTHLDNPKAADDIRLQQTQQLIGYLDGREPAIILGDFNADPGTAVLNTFDESGFRDPGTTFMPDTYTTTDQRRLDYILVSNRFEVETMGAVESPASDHKPVVAVLTLNPRQ